jgi:hypothetical protein
MVMTTYDNDWISTSPQWSHCSGEPVAPSAMVTSPSHIYEYSPKHLCFDVCIYICIYTWICIHLVYIYIYVHVDMIPPAIENVQKWGFNQAPMFLLLAEHRNWKLVESSWQLLFRTKEYVRAYLRFPQGPLKLKAPRVPCISSSITFFWGYNHCLNPKCWCYHQWVFTHWKGVQTGLPKSGVYLNSNAWSSWIFPVKLHFGGITY